jgi:hypothetical protein
MLFSANIGDMSSIKTLKVERDMTKMGKSCVECHAKETPGMVNDWKESRHGHVGISCIDCHQVKKDSPMATQACPGVKGTDVYISLIVTPKTCERCHPSEVKEFHESGHARAGLQVMAKEGMQKLMKHYEGADHPECQNSPEATGCMQCHGTQVVLDKDNRPTAETWPQAGMGSIYPDGSVGNCASCHTRHKFSIEEARKPAACASCHLGPDHPDIEIYNNSKHGHIFNAEGTTWKYDSAPDAWEPGDYRAPTCATCHMSGIGDTKTTHNVSRRLKWNLWAPKSNLRDGGLDTAVKVWVEEGKATKGNPVAGHPDGSAAGRAEMEQVCSSCHSSLHTKNFFTMADKHVVLYNESYFAPAAKMLADLKEKGLLKPDPWTDEFQKIYYHLWHHQGRRMRQGALMNGPDYSHWHGVFELQQNIRELQTIYDHRIKTGSIE